MAFAVYVPKVASSWDNYWQQSDFERELSLCQTDGLLPIFQKYLKRNQKILEAGCGLGKWVVFLSREGFNIIGVDTNSYAIKQLRKHFPRVKARIADVKALSFDRESFDVYVSLGVIEHFQNGPKEALAEAFRVLKSGGMALIEVPYDNRQRQIFRLIENIKMSLKTPVRRNLELSGLRSPRKKPAMVFYEYHYTKTELGKFVKASGFKILGWYPKDDLDPQKSIGLWLDFPRLREKRDKADFRLKPWGRRLKAIYNFLGWQEFYSACIVCVAQKPEKQ